METIPTVDRTLPRALRPLLFPIRVTVISMSSGVESLAQSTMVSPASQSSHWSHINVSDFGRALPFQGDASVRSTAYNWFNQHVDLAEVTGNAMDLRSTNPSMHLFIYQLDLSIFANADSANLPEEYFLDHHDNHSHIFHSSTSASPPSPRPSMQEPTGLLGKLKGLMQRVK